MPYEVTKSEAEWREQLTVNRLREILRYANGVGALTSLTQGVIPALPTTAQVRDFLARQPKPAI